MQDIQEKFKVDIDKLRTEQLSVIKSIKREGVAHMSYWYKTMSVFKFPERRVKCYDTMYYEQVLPEVDKILEEFDKRKTIANE